MGPSRKPKDKDAHYTCTSNKRHGSGRDNEYPVITDEQVKKHFGYKPRCTNS